MKVPCIECPVLAICRAKTVESGILECCRISYDYIYSAGHKLHPEEKRMAYYKNRFNKVGKVLGLKKSRLNIALRRKIT